MLKRSAFTLIELVFAIVIIAITVLSLPMMRQSLANGSDAALNQEAIFAAATELNLAITYRWDENSSDDNQTTYGKVLPISDTECDSEHRRPGHIAQPYHRRCSDDNSLRPSPTLGLDADDSDIPDDNDDLNGTQKSLYAGDATTSAGYKKDLNATTTVNYAGFGDVQESDKAMKKTTITVSNSVGDVIVRLSTYSANIGEVEYYYKRYY